MSAVTWLHVSHHTQTKFSGYVIVHSVCIVQLCTNYVHQYPDCNTIIYTISLVFISLDWLYLACFNFRLFNFSCSSAICSLYSSYNAHYTKCVSRLHITPVLHEHFVVSTLFVESMMKEIVQHLIDNHDPFLKLQHKKWQQLKIYAKTGKTGSNLSSFPKKARAKN